LIMWTVIEEICICVPCGLVSMVNLII